MKLLTSLSISICLLTSTFGNIAPLRSVKDSIPNSYIINLKKNVRSNILDAHLDVVKGFLNERSNFNKIEKVYKNLGNMYHGKFNDEVVNKIRKLPDVDFIERDGIAHGANIQYNAPYSLARISQHEFVNKTTYTYNGDGTGVTVYVIDSGIQIDHNEFEGRAFWGTNLVADSPDIDENGHGTHCAGVIGSKSYGVAKNVSIVAVKVLNKDNKGTWSDIISGFNWVVGDQRGKKGNIISASLQDVKSDSLNSAVDFATSNGILSVIAAGNFNTDACRLSPASADTAFTVAASDENDKSASFSNYGKCVDIIAPGVDIISTWNNNGTKVLSGTSSATPYVAGVAAILYSKSSYKVDEIKAFMQSSSTKNAISGFNSDTKNYLLYNNVV